MLEAALRYTTVVEAVVVATLVIVQLTERPAVEVTFKFARQVSPTAKILVGKPVTSIVVEAVLVDADEAAKTIAVVVPFWAVVVAVHIELTLKAVEVPPADMEPVVRRFPLEVKAPEREKAPLLLTFPLRSIWNWRVIPAYKPSKKLSFW